MGKNSSKVWNKKSNKKFDKKDSLEYTYKADKTLIALNQMFC